MNCQYKCGWEYKKKQRYQLKWVDFRWFNENINEQTNGDDKQTNNKFQKKKSNI